MAFERGESDTQVINCLAEAGQSIGVAGDVVLDAPKGGLNVCEPITELGADAGEHGQRRTGRSVAARAVSSTQCVTGQCRSVAATLYKPV